MPDELKPDELEEVAAALRAYATNRHAEGLTDPEADITPMMHLIGSVEPKVLIGVISPAMFSPESHDDLGEMFELAIKQFDAHVFGMIWGVYTADADPEFEWPESGLLRDHPETVENLAVWVAHRDGRVRSWLAPILRDGEQPPALAPWRELGPPEFPQFSFLACVYRALLRMGPGPEGYDPDSETGRFIAGVDAAISAHPEVLEKLTLAIAEMIGMSLGDMAAIRSGESFAAMWAKVVDLEESQRERLISRFAEILREAL